MFKHISAKNCKIHVSQKVSQITEVDGSPFFSLSKSFWSLGLEQLFYIYYFVDQIGALEYPKFKFGKAVSGKGSLSTQ
jgi:hypothetical protein